MSRYRIRGPRSGMMDGGDDDLEYAEFSDDEVDTGEKDVKDTDSEDSYEIGNIPLNKMCEDRSPRSITPLTNIWELGNRY